MANGRDIKKGCWVVITGASSGLGVDFAHAMAARGCNLVLVARRKELLERLGDDISARYAVHVRHRAVDLLDSQASTRLYESLVAEKIAVDILINNAGIGYFGRVLDVPWEKDRDTMLLNMVAVVELTRLFAKDMARRGFGRILLVASTGAYQPVPSMASYGASKAFVLSFGEALARELVGTGVTCTVLSPGYTATEFHRTGGQPITWLKRAMMMESRKVAAIGIRAMLAGRRTVVAGLANAVLAWSTRFVPRRLSTWMSYRIVGGGR